MTIFKFRIYKITYFSLPGNALFDYFSASVSTCKPDNTQLILTWTCDIKNNAQQMSHFYTSNCLHHRLTSHAFNLILEFNTKITSLLFPNKKNLPLYSAHISPTNLNNLIASSAHNKLKERENYDDDSK